MMREKMSRPNWSVPSRNCQLGGCDMCSKEFAVGSNGATTSANTAISTMRSTISPPAKPSGCLRIMRRVKVRTDGRSMRPDAGDIGVVVMSAALRSAVPDARIETRIEAIDQQVGNHDHQDRKSVG